jgi:hypothetical protein
MPKYVATIYFEADEDTDLKSAFNVATDRLSDFSSDINVHDVNIEPYSDEPTTPSNS